MKGLIFSNSVESRNVGAYRIAHVLRSVGWDVEVLDFFSYWKENEIKEFLKQRIDSETKFIGYGTLFFNRNQVPYWFFDYIKENYPDIITIFGCQVQTGMNNENINYTLSGWADYSIVSLLSYLFSNGPMPKFSQDSVTKNINSNESHPAFPLNDLAVEYEDRDFLQPYESLTIELARGCKFKCKFCNFPVLGVKGDYSRTADNFKYQLQNTYDKYGVVKYTIADETVNDSTQKIIKYADAVEQLSFKPYFSGFIRPDLLIHHSSQKEHLLRMNVISHYYGIESFNYASAKVVGKGMPIEKIKDGLIEIKEYFQSNGDKNYRGTIGLIVGLPYETKATIDATAKWIKTHWFDQSINPFALEIPVSDINQKSVFSIDYAKYGYEEYKVTDSTEKLLIQNHFDETHVGISEKTLIWKNKDLNYADAISITNQLGDLQSTLRLNNFALFRLKDLNFDATVEDNLDYYVFDLVELYKRKKLSSM